MGLFRKVSKRSLRPSFMPEDNHDENNNKNKKEHDDDEVSLSSLESSESFHEELLRREHDLHDSFPTVDLLPHDVMLSFTQRDDFKPVVKQQLKRFGQEFPYILLFDDTPEVGSCKFRAEKMVFSLEYDDDDSTPICECPSSVSDPRNNARTPSSSGTFQVRAELCSVDSTKADARTQLQAKLEELKEAMKQENDTSLYVSECGNSVVLAKRHVDVSLLEFSRCKDFETMLEDFFDLARCCRKSMKDAKKRRLMGVGLRGSSSKSNSVQRRNPIKDSFLRNFVVATKAA